MSLQRSKVYFLWPPWMLKWWIALFQPLGAAKIPLNLVISSPFYFYLCYGSEADQLFLSCWIFYGFDYYCMGWKYLYFDNIKYKQHQIYWKIKLGIFFSGKSNPNPHWIALFITLLIYYLLSTFLGEVYFSIAKNLLQITTRFPFYLFLL